ncbi:MAG: outer membrane protein assembly factor BamA, partial [Spirochaetia bacterium]|nr:outer membrane protein assembly factor BamA [Spirochaetia bacterium]
YMISEHELDGIVDSFIGKTFDDNLFMELQNKLFSLDYFEDMTSTAYPGREDISKYDPANTVIIKFKMVEYPSISKIKVAGNKNVRKNTLLDEIMLKPGDVVTSAKVKMEEERLLDLYLEKGFTDVVVHGEIGEKDTDNTVVVTFRIDEGYQMRVREIVFVGNTVISTTALKRNLESKQQGLFRQGLYQESNVEEDIENIEDFYSEKGYIKAKVTDVTNEVVPTDQPDRTGLRLTYYIDEGEQYTYEGISFVGNIIHDDEELGKLVRCKPGDVLNKVRMQADFVRISDLYFDDGYIFNSISEQEQINEEAKSVSYIVTIVEEGRAHIESIVLQGNDKTKDRVILRELPIGVGDVFSKKKIIEGVQNLYNLQYFSAIYPETPAGSEYGLMNLILNVEEGKTTDVQFGLIFSADAGDIPVSAFVKWTDRNFLGNGQEFSIGTEMSTSVQSVTTSFTERWLADRRLSGTISLSLSHETTANVAQDIINPVFDNDKYKKGQVPDQYDGHMVDRHTGEPYTEDDAITDYEYA